MFYCILKRNAVRGIWCTLQKCRNTASVKRIALKWAFIFRNRNIFCSLASSFFIFPLNLSHRSLSQGQAKVFALLEGLDPVPDDAEVYVVLEGSTLVHVTRAQSDVMLFFIVPGMCMCMSIWWECIAVFIVWCVWEISSDVKLLILTIPGFPLLSVVYWGAIRHYLNRDTHTNTYIHSLWVEVWKGTESYQLPLRRETAP